MAVTYKLTSASGNMAFRSDGAFIPWDPQNNCPADVLGHVGDEWRADGSPAALPFAPAQSDLAASVSSAASAAAGFLLDQVAPDKAHLVAYQNAAAVVAGNAGSPPSADPLMSAFNAQATAAGFTPQQFASLAVAVNAVSMSLSAALYTLQAAAQAATTPAQLATALTNFEGAIGNLVSTLNGAGLKVTIKAPPAISIPGVNA